MREYTTIIDTHTHTLVARMLQRLADGLDDDRTPCMALERMARGAYHCILLDWIDQQHDEGWTWIGPDPEPLEAGSIWQAYTSRRADGLGAVEVEINATVGRDYIEIYIYVQETTTDGYSEHVVDQRQYVCDTDDAADLVEFLASVADVMDALAWSVA
jgi:hypothetical protein